MHSPPPRSVSFSARCVRLLPSRKQSRDAARAPLPPTLPSLMHISAAPASSPRPSRLRRRSAYSSPPATPILLVAVFLCALAIPIAASLPDTSFVKYIHADVSNDAATAVEVVPAAYVSDATFSSKVKFAAAMNSANATTLNTTKLQTALASQPFKLVFNCTVANASVCDYARKSAASASTRITASLKIYKQIVVQVNFFPFCPSPQDVAGASCARRGLVGQATAASLIPARTQAESVYYQYPQALIKQMNLNLDIQDSQYHPIDINAEFNSDSNFWFAASNKPIQKTQIDFEYAVIHELTHGLGFKTGWTQWSQSPDLAASGALGNFLAPLPDQSNPISVQFLPLTVFDKFLANPSTGESLQSLWTAVQDYKPRNANLKTFVTEFQTSGKPFTAAQSVMSLTQSGARSIFFVSKIADSAVSAALSTSPFVSGTSIMHLDYDQYWLSPDFLMIPTVDNLKGMTLDDIIRRYSAATPDPALGLLPAYGPSTLAMMQAMGWPTNTRPGQQSVVLLSGNASASGAVSSAQGLWRGRDRDRWRYVMWNLSSVVPVVVVVLLSVVL